MNSQTSNIIIKKFIDGIIKKFPKVEIKISHECDHVFLSINNYYIQLRENKSGPDVSTFLINNDEIYDATWLSNLNDSTFELSLQRVIDDSKVRGFNF